MTGTLTWPDGHPAIGASVYFYNHDPGFVASGWSDGEYQVEPLSSTWYTSDQSTVQSERMVLDPSLNGGDYSAYAGTWQAAELRASGGGSGGSN